MQRDTKFIKLNVSLRKCVIRAQQSFIVFPNYFNKFPFLNDFFGVKAVELHFFFTLRYYLALLYAQSDFSSKERYLTQTEYANSYLKYFATNFAAIYREHYLIYDVHSLVNFASD